MKNVGQPLAQAAVWGLTAAACVLLVSVHAAQGSARVQAIRAERAEYTMDGVAWNPLQAGTVLQAGSTVRTDSMGVVDLNLGKNGDWVRLTPSTTLHSTRSATSTCRSAASSW